MADTKRRITITIDSDSTDVDAVEKILAVMRRGKISNNDTQYCYVTQFKDGQYVSARLTDTGSHSFRISKN